MRLLKRLALIAIVLLAAARPAAASPITVLVGDKDWFGTQSLGHGKVAGVDLGPWDDSQLWDWRSLAEQGAGNGAQLTDLYSALFPPYPVDWGPCNSIPGPGGVPPGDPGCTPNGGSGFVALPFSGTLQSASLSILAGGFQSSLWGAITVDVNGVSIPFSYNMGTLGTDEITITLDASMIAAANLAGEVRVNLLAQLDGDSGIDYFAFDYFEMNADVAHAPEPATFVLLGLGLAGIAARRRLRGK